MSALVEVFLCRLKRSVAAPPDLGSMLRLGSTDWRPEAEQKSRLR